MNAAPTSDINNMYGTTNTTARTTSQKNPCGPLCATCPSVSSPTNAQIVKNTMSNRRSDLISFAFSATASTVVRSTASLAAMPTTTPPKVE